MRPISFLIDDAVRTGNPPLYIGWDRDPIALRVTGYQALDRGETDVALASFRRAMSEDPLMFFAPHHLDAARLLTMMGADGQESTESEAIALVAEVEKRGPVLAAWYRGESVPSASWGFLDRHYRMEFVDAMSVQLDSLPIVPDKLDWTYYRRRGADALGRGESAEAVKELERSLYLARMNYGHDPVLYRLLEIATRDEKWARLAERTSQPAFPWPHYAFLMQRIPPATSGDNSGWWPER